MPPVSQRRLGSRLYFSIKNFPDQFWTSLDHVQDVDMARALLVKKFFPKYLLPKIPPKSTSRTYFTIGHFCKMVFFSSWIQLSMLRVITVGILHILLVLKSTKPIVGHTSTQTWSIVILSLSAYNILSLTLSSTTSTSKIYSIIMKLATPITYFPHCEKLTPMIIYTNFTYRSTLATQTSSLNLGEGTLS